MLNPVSPLLPDWLNHSAANTPDRLAVQCGQTRWSFVELQRQADRLARQLATLGVAENSRVALFSPNRLAYIAFVHALIHLGAILVPLNTRLTREELCWQINDIHATLLVSEESLSEHARAIAAHLPELPMAMLYTVSPAPGISDIILHTMDGAHCSETPFAARPFIDLSATQAIIYTSGTTGHPKGVQITYSMQWWNALGSVLNLGLHADDCWLACLPLFHIGGLSLLMKNVIYGLSIVLYEKFDEHEINRAICAGSITLISVVSVMLQRMLDALTDGDREARYPVTLRTVLLGGGPVPRPLLESCAQLNIPVAQTYGLTESCSQAVTLALAEALRKPGSAGRPLLPVQLQIRGDSGPLPPNQPGVIYLQGPTITPGYADQPELTAAAFQDGWFCTGDLGYLDEEGYLYVLDRRSDLIISGGENVYPAEIESVLQSHPDVAEAGVCGQRDARWGQVPVAFIRLYPGKTTTEDAILAYVRSLLARYKVPRTLYFVDELPHNSAGKLLRRELRARS